MAEDSDAGALVPAVLAHDEAAAQELVRQLHSLVARLVRSYRPRRMAEEDLSQMIFIKIFQKLPQFSGKVPLEHWVSRVAINTCLNQIQSEKFVRSCAMLISAKKKPRSCKTLPPLRMKSRPTCDMPHAIWSSISSRLNRASG